MDEKAPGNMSLSDDENMDELLRHWVRHLLISKNIENKFDTSIDRFSAILVSEALNLSSGNRSRAAKLLGISRPTLHAKIEKYDLKLETSVKD
jgi:two-component system nitrogen regulation response regulator GlnG